MNELEKVLEAIARNERDPFDRCEILRSLQAARQRVKDAKAYVKFAESGSNKCRLAWAKAELEYVSRLWNEKLEEYAPS